MSFFKPFRPLLKGWLFSFLGWGMLAAALGVQLSRMAVFPWQNLILIGLRDWFPLAVITPLLFRAVSRFPIERERVRLTLPVYLASCVAVVFLCRWWAEEVIPPEMVWRNVSRSGRSAEQAPSPPPPQNPATSKATAGNAPSTSPERGRGGGGGGPRWKPFWLFGPAGLQLALYLVLLSVAHALHFYRRAQEREKRSLELTASLAQARLSALRMQLQPHFLFNSLNAVAALVHKDPDSADEMIGALSRFLRLTLESSEDQEVPLRRELEFVEKYLAIEKVRFGDRLRFEISAPAETQGAMVPALILQPLVENAIRHGLAPRVDAGEVHISAVAQNGHLILQVRDNGIGFHAAGMREGVGLANTKARLKETYGNEASMTMTDDGGVSVRMEIPLRKTV